MPNLTNASPAEKLLAVLRVVVPDAAIRHDPQWVGWTRGHWDTFGTDLVLVRRVHEDGTNWWADGDHEAEQRNEHFDATSKDDLTRVVAMLTPEQLVAFDDVLVTLHDEDPKENSGLCHAWAIALSASTWLDALVTAVI